MTNTSETHDRTVFELADAAFQSSSALKLSGCGRQGDPFAENCACFRHVSLIARNFDSMAFH